VSGLPGCAGSSPRLDRKTRILELYKFDSVAGRLHFEVEPDGVVVAEGVWEYIRANGIP
jgi:hypothetical protein